MSMITAAVEAGSGIRLVSILRSAYMSSETEAVLSFKLQSRADSALGFARQFVLSALDSSASAWPELSL
ncbi:MAG TPA: hypothetical protein VHV10_06600, partial [Ktedonobacteraceae bacterium]|nr:hypothetical protein [Ktedonobacteraceae bacterium]